MIKRLSNRMLARVVVLAFMGMAVAGCNKYDKMDIFGEWTIDLKAAKNLDVFSATETLLFNSDFEYTEEHVARSGSAGGNLDRWTVKGSFKRKNNKITFSNRNSDKEGQKPDVSYKYRIEGDKLTLIIKDEGFKNDEKVYTRKKKG